jgi:hypothetical protein
MLNPHAVELLQSQINLQPCHRYNPVSATSCLDRKDQNPCAGCRMVVTLNGVLRKV